MKFLWMYLIGTVVAIVFGVVFVVFRAIAGGYINSYALCYFISMVISIAIVFPIIKRVKCSNRNKRSQYIKEKEKCKLKALIAIKSADFRQEVIAFLLFLIPINIGVIRTTDFSSTGELVFVFFFSTVIIGLCYGFLSFLLLIWVYHSWEKRIN